jgi:hypothetical protein
MSRYCQFSCELTVSENLYKLVLVDESCLTECVNCDHLEVVRLSESLESSYVDTLVLYASWISETELRKSSLDRHLTSLEADLARVTRTSLSTLVTTCRCSTVTRTLTTSDSLLAAL